MKPTLNYLLHNGLVVRTHNQAGEQVYSLTTKGELYFSPDVDSRVAAFWEDGA